MKNDAIVRAWICDKCSDEGIGTGCIMLRNDEERPKYCPHGGGDAAWYLGHVMVKQIYEIEVI